MAYYGSSAARDFDFEERPHQEVEKKTERSMRVVQRKNSRTSFFTLRNVAIFLAVVAGICFLLYNQVRLNEINGRISQTKAEIRQLESEYVRMQSSLESSLSLRAVERYAEQELGLQRLDQYQTEYICLYEDERVVISQPPEPEGISEKTEAFVGNIVQNIKALFGAA